MRLEEIKKGFWGYKKDDVFQYITELEDSLSQKMLEKESQVEESGKQFQKRIQEMENENKRLKAEIDSLKSQQDQISMAILDARASAEAMKAESKAKEEEARAEITSKFDKDMAELAKYHEKIVTLREKIQKTLETFVHQTESIEKQIEELEEAPPTENLTLFK